MIWNRVVLDFKSLQKCNSTFGRAGEFHLKHGTLKTPVFMPVGTYGTVRGLSSLELQEISPDIMLANTYHLYTRPGIETIEALGGLHRFMNWDKPILTDSGGFQVFSLGQSRVVNDEGVTFRSHHNGDLVHLNPEIVVDVQERWGSDVMMVLDECPPADAKNEKIEAAVDRTTLWAARAKDCQTKKDLALFPINQGACLSELREKSLKDLLQLEVGRDPWPGLAIGGLSVGETKKEFVDTLFQLRKILPTDRPRYLMGVGTPRDLVYAVACGVDMFDCVIPSRNARHGIVMTRSGRINMHNAQYIQDTRPLDKSCVCSTCQNFQRGFIRHLLSIGDPLGARLLTHHNVYYFVSLLRDIRERILEGSFGQMVQDFLQNPKTQFLGGESGFRDFPDFYL